MAMARAGRWNRTACRSSRRFFRLVTSMAHAGGFGLTAPSVGRKLSWSSREGGEGPLNGYKSLWRKSEASKASESCGCRDVSSKSESDSAVGSDCDQGRANGSNHGISGSNTLCSRLVACFECELRGISTSLVILRSSRLCGMDEMI